MFYNKFFFFFLLIVPTNAIYTYFVVNAKIKNGMDHSGYRKRIYEDAQQYCACYDVRDPSCSIWYPDDSRDLHIKLLFLSKMDAHHFIACLVNYNEGHTLLKGSIEIQKKLEVFSSEIEAEYIFKDEYVFAATESPENTREGILSTSEVSIASNPVYQMRSVEDLSKFIRHEKAEKCHIAPLAFFSQYDTDPDNFIYESHLFHKFFDGDGKRRPDHAHIGWGDSPKLMLQYDGTGSNHMFQGVRYHMIFVLIIFEEPEVARGMAGRWREGTTVVDDLTFRSFFYTTNVDHAVQYLAIKQKETKVRWSEPSDD